MSGDQLGKKAKLTRSQQKKLNSLYASERRARLEAGNDGNLGDLDHAKFLAQAMMPSENQRNVRSGKTKLSGDTGSPLSSYSNHPRVHILVSVAKYLPNGDRGSVHLAAELLNNLTSELPFIQSMPNQILLNRVAYVAEKSHLNLYSLLQMLDLKGEHYTKDHFFIVDCWSCNRKICLVPNSQNSDTAYDIHKRWNTCGKKHDCDNVISGKSEPSYDRKYSEVVGQHYVDENDGAKGLGHIRREGGRFGSSVTRDDHDS